MCQRCSAEPCAQGGDVEERLEEYRVELLCGVVDGGAGGKGECWSLTWRADVSVFPVPNQTVSVIEDCARCCSLGGLKR